MLLQRELYLWWRKKTVQLRVPSKNSQSGESEAHKPVVRSELCTPEPQQEGEEEL